MVSETINPFEKIANLKKLSPYTDWKVDFKVYPYESEYEKDNGCPDHFAVLYRYSEHTFYELMDKWDQEDVNYVIYPILGKQYWVVEVRLDGRGRDKG